MNFLERGKIDTSNTQIHDHSFSWLGADLSIKCYGIKIVLWAQPFPLTEIMQELSIWE